MHVLKSRLLTVMVFRDRAFGRSLVLDKPVNPKGNQSWIFIGRTDAVAEAPKFWPPDMKSWLIGKDPDVGKDRSREEKGMTEGKMVGWHHQLNGHKFEQAPGDSEKQGSLLYCSPWGLQRVGHDWATEQHKDGLPLMKLLFLYRKEKREKLKFLFSLPWDDTVKKQLSVRQKEGSLQNSTTWSLISSLQNGRNKFPLFKPPSLWYFVMAAQAG